VRAAGARLPEAHTNHTKRTLMSLPLLPIAVVASLAAPPPEADLKVGDPAPALKVAKWVSGKEVKLADGKDKNIYVVEFWATWCGPCIQTIPHMTKIANRFEKQGVIVVGVSIDSEKSRDRVEPFVKKMGKKMGYTVALDDDGATGKAFLDAAGAEGIPHSFLVGKDGKIAWHGHPMDGLDIRIAELVGDKEYADLAKKVAELREKLGQTLEEEKEGKWDAVIDTIDKLAALQPEEQGLLVFKYKVLAAGKKDKKAAAAWGEELLKKVDSQADLDGFAWRILKDKELEGERDKKLALAGALKANELAKGEDWSILDTLALAQFENGDPKQALETQKKAIAVAEKEKAEEDEINFLKESLKNYEGDGKKAEEEKKAEGEK
jgi:thiol-disulfide isomerase/thioredoxin